MNKAEKELENFRKKPNRVCPITGKTIIFSSEVASVFPLFKKKTLEKKRAFYIVQVKEALKNNGNKIDQITIKKPSPPFYGPEYTLEKIQKRVSEGEDLNCTKTKKNKDLVYYYLEDCIDENKGWLNN